MDFVLTLHGHLPYVLHHGRWPHGSVWLCEGALDSYLPLIEALQALEKERIPAPFTPLPLLLVVERLRGFTGCSGSARAAWARRYTAAYASAGWRHEKSLRIAPRAGSRGRTPRGCRLRTECP